MAFLTDKVIEGMENLKVDAGMTSDEIKECGFVPEKSSVNDFELGNDGCEDQDPPRGVQRAFDSLMGSVRTHNVELNKKRIALVAAFNGLKGDQLSELASMVRDTPEYKKIAAAKAAAKA